MPRKSVKSKRTFYTDTRVRAARKNIETWSWAREMADEAIAKAAPSVDGGFDALYDLITPQSIPRASRIHEVAGCPVCGDAINKLGMFPYVFEPEGEKWTIGCPLCKTVFPSNDFGAYYASGLDERGIFDPDLADRSLLVNTRYPDRPDSWLVDDGRGGCADDTRYMLVAHYNHWANWGIPMVNLTGFGKVFSALLPLRDAFLYTDDVRYADALTVLLHRIATVYPDMDIAAYPWSEGYCNSSGCTDTGKITGRIWECRVARYFVLAYDAVFPAIDSGRCADAMKFLASRGETAMTDAVIDHIEGALVRNMFKYVEAGQIRGNKGMHESTLGVAAVVLDDIPTATRWLDWIYAPGDEDRDRTPVVTGGDLENVLTNQVDRDGMGDEAAPSYNSIWIRDLKILADALDDWDGPDRYKLYDHPVYRKMFTPYPKIIMLGNYLPSIADSGSCGDPGIGRRGAIEEFYAIDGFARYNIPELARFAEFIDPINPLHLDIFTGNQEKKLVELEETVEKHGRYEPESIHMTGYGLSAIRKGFAWDTWMYYGRTYGHGHADSLTIGLHAFGLDLAPDIGNPEHKNAYNRMTHEWFKNTINHNTVIVDESRQKSVFGGIPRGFASGTVFGLIDVESPGVYPQASLYRRGVVSVQIGKDGFYLVDFFRIRGGSTHHYGFHGAEGPIAQTTLKPVEQQGGSYAGVEVPYGYPYDATGDDVTSYTGSGLHYLDKVERDSSPTVPIVAEWKIIDTWHALESPQDIRLRLTMLSDVDEAAFADGRPASNYIGNPERLRYLLARREGADLESHFVSVIEPYRDARLIESVRRAEICRADVKISGVFESAESKAEIIGRHDCDAAAVCVTHVEGAIDYIITSLDPDIEYTIDGTIRFAGMYGMIRLRDGQAEHALLYGGTLLEFDGEPLAHQNTSGVTGAVIDFTRERSIHNEITVRVDGGDVHMIRPGDFMYVDNRWVRSGKGGDIRNGVLEIVAISQSENAITFDVGDTTLIEGYLDPWDHEKGFAYTIEIGDRFFIPAIAAYG